MRDASAGDRRIPSMMMDVRYDSCSSFLRSRALVVSSDDDTPSAVASSVRNRERMSLLVKTWYTIRRRTAADVSKSAPVTVPTSSETRANLFSSGGSLESSIVWTIVRVDDASAEDAVAILSRRCQTSLC